MVLLVYKLVDYFLFCMAGFIVFASGMVFQPSLIFEGKAGTYPCGAFLNAACPS
jgi:hypothetical protein